MDISTCLLCGGWWWWGWGGSRDELLCAAHSVGDRAVSLGIKVTWDFGADEVGGTGITTLEGLHSVLRQCALYYHDS